MKSLTWKRICRLYKEYRRQGVIPELAFRLAKEKEFFQSWK